MPTPASGTESFPYDIFLSHSAKDKAVVRPLAERLRQDGLTSNAKGPRLKAKVEFQPSAFSLQPFQCAPLNQEHRLIPLRLDDAPPRSSRRRLDFRTADSEIRANRLLPQP